MLGGSPRRHHHAAEITGRHGCWHQRGSTRPGAPAASTMSQPFSTMQAARHMLLRCDAPCGAVDGYKRTLLCVFIQPVASSMASSLAMGLFATMTAACAIFDAAVFQRAAPFTRAQARGKLEKSTSSRRHRPVRRRAAITRHAAMPSTRCRRASVLRAHRPARRRCASAPRHFGRRAPL